MIGRRLPSVGAGDRVTGRVQYADDLRFPGMLHAKILRSPHPHARIQGIRTERALALAGVHAVITGSDMPNRYGILPWTQDEYPLAVDKVRYVGDAVAAVAAVTERIAAEAARFIEVEWEVLPFVLEPEAALAPGAIRIHDDKEGNLTKHVHLEFGDVESELAASDIVVDGDYHFEGTTHAALEPHCAIGKWETDGTLTVISTTQVPHYLHRELSRVLEIPTDRVRVIQPPLGGAFGGKSEPFDLEFCAAKLSMITGRPVKILYTREEVFYAHRGRHPMRMSYRLGATKDGRLTGCDARVVADGGAYSSFGLVTTYYSGQLVTAPLALRAYRFDSKRVYTNKPACGPKRGHGSVQPRFAFEVTLDKLATSLNIDPIDLRRRNLLAVGDRTINGFLLRSNGFAECLDRVETTSGWREKHRRLPRGQGIGMAGSFYISGTNYPIYPNNMPQSAVQIKADRSGRVTVFSGASEIGQGVNTMLAMVAAEELGVELAAIRVVTGDTDLTPVDLGAYSSRVTMMAGNACRKAAQSVAERVRTAMARRWETSLQEVVLADGRATCAGRTDRDVSMAEAFALTEAELGSLGGIGHYHSPSDGHGSYRGATIGASPSYSFTAQVAQVRVDLETGMPTVEKIWIAHDCGKALNPTIVEGQIEGSAYMGFAEALFEAQLFHDSGLHKGPSLLDYKIPTALDCPDLAALIVEAGDSEGPYGAKEVGEGPLHPSIPAIANAIHDATGIRIDSLPFSAARILRLLRENAVSH